MRTLIISTLLILGTTTSFPSLSAPVQIETCDSDVCRAKFKKYRKYARNGSPQAQMVLAGMYYSGYGVERNSKKSLHWYRQAGKETNFSFAKLRAGLLFLYDKDIDQNVDKGIELLSKAADSDNVEAANQLANLYIKGELVEQNLLEAEKWLLIASELDDDSSQYRLGLMYEVDMLGQKQPQKAIEFYKKAALNNNNQAKERLSLLGAEHIKEDIFASTKNNNIEKITVTAPDLSSLLDISLATIRDSGQYGRHQSCSRIPGTRGCQGIISITDKGEIEHSVNTMDYHSMKRVAAMTNR